jgi:hypothetical protein
MKTLTLWFSDNFYVLKQMTARKALLPLDVFLSEKSFPAKMFRERTLFFSLLLVSLFPLHAQETVEIRNGSLVAYLAPNGGLTNPSDIHWLAYEQNGENVPLIHYSGLWMGGLDPAGNLFVTDLRDGGQPGPFGAEIPFNKVWTVTAEDIFNHLADFEDNGAIDDPIPAIYAWPAKGNIFFEDYNEGLELPSGNLYSSAPFWDMNGDGFYDPESGDYPILGIRGCKVPMIPSQMHWCSFLILDDVGGSPLMEAQITIFAYECEEMDNELNDALFTHYKVINYGIEPISDMYWGLFTDPDLGCPFDDYIGSFPERAAAYAYNADNEDESCANLPGFGMNPPALGMDVLRGPIDESGQEMGRSSIMPFFSPGFGNYPPGTTDPASAPEYYNYLQGKWRDGSPLTFGDLGYNGTEETNFAFPGLPQQEDAWTEWEDSNPPGDRRILINYGPFTLLPGAVNEFLTTYTVFDGAGNHLEKAEGLRDQIDALQSYFDSCFELENNPTASPCNQVLTSTATPAVTPGYRIFPNPSSNIIRVSSDLPVDKLQLLSIDGRLIVESNQTEINVQGLASSLYILRIEIGDKEVYEKVIIQ